MRSVFFLTAFLAFVLRVSSVPEIEDQDDSLTEIEKDDVSRSTRWTWRRCDSNYRCPDGYHCKLYWSGYWCAPKKTCRHHQHCYQGQYCDFQEGICKTGERPCSSHNQCSHGRICLNGKCQNRQCSHDGHCAGEKICAHPGLCQDYKKSCHNHYYCRHGFVCISGWCKKPECSYHKPCQQGQQCQHPGICKPIPGYCASNDACDQAEQCCLNRRCNPKVSPGHWCLMRPNGRGCPCMPGHYCKAYYGNYHWGRCTKEPTRPPTPPTTSAPPTTEEPGSGSGDFLF